MWRMIVAGLALALGSVAAQAEELTLRVERAEIAVETFGGGPALHVWLSPEARKAFARFTVEHVGQQADLLVNGTVVTSPVIQTPIDTEMLVLSGLESMDEAHRTLLLLTAKKASIVVRPAAP